MGTPKYSPEGNIIGYGGNPVEMPRGDMSGEFSKNYANSLINWQPENLNPQPIGGMSFGSINQTPYLSGIDMFKGMSSSAMQGGVGQTARNAAQRADKTASVLSESLSAVQGLMNQGKAIPSGLAEQGLNMKAYGSIEKDIRGNIIGLAPKLVYGPTGATEGTVSNLKPYEAKQGSAGNPLTPGLDAFKAMQNEKPQPESEQSRANRETHEAAVKASYQPQIKAQQARVAQEAAQAGKPTLPTGANVYEKKDESGTSRIVLGPSGYAKAFIPEKKKDIA